MLYRNTHNTNFEVKIALKLHYAATTHHAYSFALRVAMTPQSLWSAPEQRRYWMHPISQCADS